MKSFDTDIKKYAEKTTLNAQERRVLRERVLSYMEYHPLRTSSTVRENVRNGIQSEPFRTLRFNAFYARLGGALAVLLLVAVSAAAQQAVPGDVLYLVKTGVNETIEGQFANSPYEKIEFETELMERRISEARELAEAGKLTDDIEAQIAENVKEHTQAVQDGLAQLRSQDAEGAAIAKIAFNSSLEVQSAVLGSDVGGGDAMTMSMKASDVAPVEEASPIENILSVVNEAREEVVNHEDKMPSFETLAANVEGETTHATKVFTSIQESAKSDELRNIERRLSDIDRLIQKAKKKHETNPDLGSSDLTTALGLVQKLTKYMTHIEVREAVPLETLVPVMLSDEEKRDIVKEEVRAIEELRVSIEERLETLGDPAVEEKMTEGLSSVEELLFKTNTALDAMDVETAETAAGEARALISDLDLMTQPIMEEMPTSTDNMPPEEPVNEPVETTTPTTTDATVEPEL